MAQNSLPKSRPNSPQKSRQQALVDPGPHAIDLLRNRDPLLPLGPFDGRVGASAVLNGEHHFITTNAEYIPDLPSLKTPHKVYLRSDMCYGTDDPALWPQQYAPEYAHMPLMAKKGSRPELNIMCAITRGLGRLCPGAFTKLFEPIDRLKARCTKLKAAQPQLCVPLFGEILEHIVRMLEQLQGLPTTFPKMSFLYMTVYKEWMNNFFLGPSSDTALPQFVGAFTTEPAVVQRLSHARIPGWFIRPTMVFDKENILDVVPLTEPRFGLPDDQAHAKGAPEALYTGNSTVDKIMAIRMAAIHTPCHRPRPQSPAARAPRPLHSIVATLPEDVTNPILVSSSARPAKQKPKLPAKDERNKFVLVTGGAMPPGVVSMAEALANVNRDALHSTQTGYVLPEPALFVTSTPQRQGMFLHHWKLLADGFLYMLGQEPQLLRPQDWRAVLEGKMSGYGRTAGLQELIRPALALCDVQTIQGLPVPVDALPQFSLRATQEIIWEVAETSFRFEFCALDKRASGETAGGGGERVFCGAHARWGASGDEPEGLGRRGWAASSYSTATTGLGWPIGVRQGPSGV
ncbi:hypothetical protein C8F04DRAFT_1277839 [Mycena alexandri]|uniref:Uncharacterized protein n=1 Tax=Mycena alexandri TaxID=1745969 RepID=A0AAD6S106_9AGAR|nr:hypothetical protein C8F04DRAFT_1277839 [Mycena alexandri]